MNRDLIPSEQSRPQVLLVEDDHGVRRSLQLLLRGRGLDVRAYASGAALLADPRALSAACLVADYKMPELSGFDVLRGLLDLGWTGQALLITGFHTAELVARAHQAGFSGVVEKPLVDSVLVEAVERLTRVPLDPAT
ncbi:response regulator [Caulobacter sp. DWR2-3-1b2]|uniref:response regulator n=1 Tax=unclassified Caulobacter TaxID=2648921 RepID=UPI0019C51F2C|nr:response regulator [Caulobacter sp.]